VHTNSTVPMDCKKTTVLAPVYIDHSSHSQTPNMHIVHFSVHCELEEFVFEC